MTDPLAIPVEQIDALIARLVALRLKPRRKGMAWLSTLCAADVMIGNDALTDTIADEEHDLGLHDEPEYRFARTSGEGFDGDMVEVRSAWGMGR